MITAMALPEGGISFGQNPHGPTVYLDQWMWGQLSQDQALRNRFLGVAASRQSCVMYSFASLMELAQIADQGQLDVLAALMDELDYGFVQSDPVETILLEKKHETKPGVFQGRHPAVDLDLLNYAIGKHYPPVPKMSALLRDLKNEVPSRYAAIADHLHQHLTPMVERAKRDTKALARAETKNRERKLGRTSAPYTQDILRCLNFFLVANETMKMTRNEWIDIFHMVVPVAYMDFMVLDKRWANFVRNHLPLRPPNIARVYSPGEIDLFLIDLASAPSKAAPPIAAASEVHYKNE